MPRLSFDCEDLLHWWEPKSDISFIFNFNWRSLQQLREAIAMFLSARLYAVSQRAARAITETGCPQLKAMIASNPQTPADMLDFLTEVSPLPVLVRVAENTACPRNTLARLAYHPDPQVRSAVADNAATPESAFKRLANDESLDVRYRVAENPWAPAASLYALVRDENPYVSSRARETLARILTNAAAAAGRSAESETESQSPVGEPDLSGLFDRQFVEELSGMCGFTTCEYVVPEIKF
jgi:hypothetical protein